MRTLEIKLKTLTPIWTGDIDKDSNIVQETGITGSLRWWYEGIIRGLGGYACDPTSETESRCKFDVKGYEKAIKEGKSLRDALNEGLKSICPACLLFGCTGWQKRFRIDLSDLITLPLFFVTHHNVYVSNGGWLSRIFGGRQEGRGRDRKFYFSQKCLWNPESFSLRIIPLHEDGEKVLNILSHLFHITTTFGALGAKSQNGFGQLRILNAFDKTVLENGIQSIREDINKISGSSEQENEPQYFDIHNFFSLLFEVKDPAPYAGVSRLIGEPPQGFDYQRYFIPCAFDIRYKSKSRNPSTSEGRDFGLRPFLKEKFKKNPQTVNLLLGESRASSDEERSASRIHVSHLFKEKGDKKYLLKIWGYVPPTCGVSKDEVKEAIKEFICEKGGMFPGSTVRKEYTEEGLQ